MTWAATTTGPAKILKYNLISHSNLAIFFQKLEFPIIWKKYLEHNSISYNDHEFFQKIWNS